MWSIIDQYNLIQWSSYDSKILDEKLVCYKCAALSIKAVLNDSCRINMIQNWVCIAFISCSKNDDIKIFCQLFQKLFSIWPYIYISTANLALKSFEGYFNLIPWRYDFTSMNKCFIHIKNNSFPV